MSLLLFFYGLCWVEPRFDCCWSNKKRSRNSARKEKNSFQPAETVTTKKVKDTLLKGTAHFTVPAPCLVAERTLA